MTHGFDTGFLVAAVVTKDVVHANALATLGRLHAAGDMFALAPQVLAELIHVITDGRRFSQPLDMNAAQQVAHQWWAASDRSRNA